MFKFLNILLVAFVLNNSRGSLPLQKPADCLSVALLFCLDIDFVVVCPERVKFTLREPNMLEVYFDFNPIHGRPDVTQSLSDVYKEHALRVLEDNFFVDTSVKIDQLDVLGNFVINFF